MAKARAIVKRRKAVRNIKKITKTMQMIATAKFQKSLKRAVGTKAFTLKVRELVRELAASVGEEVEHPLLRKVTPENRTGRVALLVITSNRGLAGGFNANLIKMARRRIEELEQGGYTAELHAVGKKGIGYFKYIGRNPVVQRTDIGDRPTADHAAELVTTLMADFEGGQLASVDLVYARFESPISTPPTTLRVLPVEAPAVQGARPDYLLKPSADEILSSLLPLYVRNAVYRGLVETAAAEHGARRTAMKNATDNAGEIIQSLKRTYNRLRQAAITQEISEIVGGAAALQD